MFNRVHILTVSACSTEFTYHLNSLQSVLNATATLILNKRKFDPITASIRYDLHWLLVQQRIGFKICLLVFKCLQSVAPVYLKEMYRLVSSLPGRHRLHSVAHGDLEIQPLCGKTKYGQRSFTMSGLKSWNQLPPDFRNPT